MAEATGAIVDAAKQKGPERIVMLSSFAVARDRLTPVTKLVTGIAMGTRSRTRPPVRKLCAPAALTGRSSTPPS